MLEPGGEQRERGRGGDVGKVGSSPVCEIWIKFFCLFLCTRNWHFFYNLLI